MAQYASKTRVPVERSKNEIEAVLKRYGASAFGYMESTGRVQIFFRVGEPARSMRFELPLEDNGGRITQRWEQDCRSRWRALVLVIKAKLEAVSSGITTIEQEFLAHIITNEGGKTVGEWLKPQLERSYSGPNAPKLLPLLDGEA